MLPLCQELETAELIRPIDAAAVASALTSWSWLPTLANQQPILSSAFGDLVLLGRDGVWFLDVMEGSHRLEWPTQPAMRECLSSWSGREVMLLAGLVDDAFLEGLAPTADEVLAFTVPPFLGGALGVANLEVRPLTTTLTALGHSHRARRAHTG